MNGAGRQHVAHLVELGRHAEALGLLAPLLAETPDDAGLLLLHTRCLLGLEEYAQALTAAERLVAADPDAAWAHRLRAIALHGLGRHEDGLTAAAEAVRLGPDEAWNHVLRAQLAIRVRGRGPEALAAARRGVELDPLLADAHVALGEVAEALAHHGLADAAYRRAAELDPEHTGALHHLTVVEHRWRIASQGRGLASALRLAPDDPALLADVDRLAGRIVRRALAYAVTSLVLGLLVVRGADDRVTPWSVSLAVLLVAGLAGSVWSTSRRLPVGLRRHLVARLRRGPVLLVVQAVALVALVLALVVCVVPGGAEVGLLALRPLGVAVVVAVVASVVSAA